MREDVPGHAAKRRNARALPVVCQGTPYEAAAGPQERTVQPTQRDDRGNWGAGGGCVDWAQSVRHARQKVRDADPNGCTLRSYGSLSISAPSMRIACGSIALVSGRQLSRLNS